MTLAGIELRYLVNEVSKNTQDYYVNNIYGVSKDSLLFKLHHPEKPDIFLMFSTFGFWMSSKKIERVEPNKMLRRLRNDLLRLKLSKIEQIGAERIVYLTFSGFDKEFILVGEFFGDGNIILCNKEMKILALLHSIDVRHRKVRVGLPYTPPPQSGLDIFEIKKEDVLEIKSSDVSVAKWIGRTFGLPKKYVEQIFRIVNIDSKTIGNTLSDDDVTRIYESLSDVVNKVVKGDHNPIIVQENENSEAYPIILGDEKNYTPIPSFMEGLDTTFTENIIKKGKSVQASSTDKKIQEFETRLDEQKKAISQVIEKSEVISAVAKSVSAMALQGITSIKDNRAIELLNESGAKIIEEKGISMIQVQDKKIKVSLDAPLQSVASVLFDESKKQAAAIQSIEKLKKKTEKELDKLKTESKTVQDSITFSEIRKKNWYERYRWFFTSDNLLAIGGRDSSSNSAVIRKHLEKNDKVFHAEIFGSPFFLLKNCTDFPAASLNEVAHATVCFSRAWREGIFGSSSYWVEPEQVKKAAPSGQFLPKGSFIIEGTRNFVKVSTLKLAVGIIKQEENYLLTCGPPEPVKKNSICYCIIEPSGSEIPDVAKKIRTEFIKMKGKTIESINLDEFVRVLPSGESHITESGLGGASE